MFRLSKNERVQITVKQNSKAIWDTCSDTLAYIHDLNKHWDENDCDCDLATLFLVEKARTATKRIRKHLRNWNLRYTHKEISKINYDEILQPLRFNREATSSKKTFPFRILYNAEEIDSLLKEIEAEIHRA